MKRYGVNRGRQNHGIHGERHLTDAARAAMARAGGGHLNDHTETTHRSRPFQALSLARMKIRSLFYRMIYSDTAVISGNLTHQSQKAHMFFRRSLLGCMFCVYIPLMGICYMLVNRAPVPQLTGAPTNPSRLEDLEHKHFPHSSLYLGPTSHEAATPANLNGELTWDSAHQHLLGDDDIDVEVEKKRCERHGLEYTNTTLSRRRRLFLGALIADDSMEVLQAIGAEGYNIFHTVSFIETNVTQNLTPRQWKFGLKSENLSRLQQLFGPRTKVSVDYYVSSSNTTDGDDLLTGALSEGNNLRWKINGMRDDDVAIVVDVDETSFSKDFLRVLQLCELPELRPGQRCLMRKVLASSCFGIQRES